MNRLHTLFNRFSESEALAQSSGILETQFFEFLYRFTYISGFSTHEKTTSYKIYRYLVQLSTFLFMSGEIWYMLTEATSLDEATKSFCVVGLQFISIFKYYNVVFNKTVFMKLAKSMDTPYFDISTESRQKIVNTWVRKSKTNLKIFFCIGTSSIVAWYLDPLFDDVEYNLPTGIKMGFDYKTPVLYPIAYVLVMIALWYAGYYVMVTGCTLQAHLVHLLCQYMVLADCFEHMLEDCSDGFEGISRNDLINNQEFSDKFTQRLDNLAKQHQLILSHTMNLKTAVNIPMLAQLAVSGSVICAICYQGATTFEQGVVKTLVSLIFLTYTVFELYIVCRWCEEITIWSSNLGESVYCSGWACGVTQIRGVRSTILIIMGRAHKPLYLTAGGMYNLTVDSFARLMKGSYSVLTMMLGSRSEQ